MSEENKKQYIVIMDCRVKKELICEGGTIDEIKEKPFAFAIDEMEICQMDWEFVSIKDAPE